MPCSRCRTCREGRYNLCREVRFLGSFLSKCPGALAQLLLHPASFCHPLPDAVSLEEGALLEPLNVALAAVRRGGVAPGHRVLVTGAGAVGLLTLMAARAAGAAHVTLTDVQPGRLALATQLGATEALNARERDVVAEVRDGALLPFDTTIECSGADACIGVCIRAARSGGKCVLVGIGAHADATLPLADATGREVDLLGVFRYANLYPAAIALVASGAVDVKPLISHHFALADTASAFRAAMTASDAVKVLIHPNGVPEGAPEAAAVRGAKRPRLEPGFANALSLTRSRSYRSSLTASHRIVIPPGVRSGRSVGRRCAFVRSAAVARRKRAAPLAREATRRSAQRTRRARRRCVHMQLRGVARTERGCVR